MRIRDLYGRGRPVVSFEIFPPKKQSGPEAVFKTLGQIAELDPDFISVTYGAGGSGAQDKTLEIASVVKNTHGVEALAHFVGISCDRGQVERMLSALKEKNIHNVLALRGDMPVDSQALSDGSYRYAADLISDIKSRGGFCIGAACYPEGHIDCENPDDDLRHMLEKQDAGADFFVSQLFFDNRLFLDFRERAVRAGIKAPISAGVMPLLSKAQIERMIFMCGASLPSRAVKLLHRHENSPDDLLKAGIEYCTEQTLGLIREGVDGVHIYTMNRPDIARANMSAIRAG